MTYSKRVEKRGFANFGIIFAVFGLLTSWNLNWGVLSTVFAFIGLILGLISFSIVNIDKKKTFSSIVIFISLLAIFISYLICEKL